MHPLSDGDDTHTGAPSGLCFPHVSYNMAATAYRLEDIFDMLDPKTKKRLNEAKRLLHITLEQQAESSASRHRATLSRPSQPTTTTNGDCSDAHTSPIGERGGESFGSSSDRLQTRGTKPR